MSEAVWLAIGGLVGGVMAWVTQFLQLRQKLKIEERQSDTRYYEGIITRLEEQTNRLERQIDDMQGSINFLHEEYTDCLLEVSDLHGCLTRFFDLASRMNEVIVSLGGKPEAIPPIPPRRQRRDPDPGFLRRTSLHGQSLAREVTQQVRQEAEESKKAGT